MPALKFAVFAMSLVAASFPQDEPSPPPDKPAAMTPVDQKALVERLMDHTKNIQSFTATYRIASKRGESTVRLIYQAPGHAPLEGLADDGFVVNWILDGRLITQADSGDEAFFTDFDFAAEFERDGGFGKVLAETFPLLRDKTGDFDKGPSFQIIAAAANDPNKSFDVRLWWHEARSRVLVWNAAPTAWTSATLEGQRLIRETSDVRITNTPKTRFVLTTMTESVTRRTRETSPKNEFVEPSHVHG